jgi:hypothetical protein
MSASNILLAALCPGDRFGVNLYAFVENPDLRESVRFNSYLGEADTGRW